MNKIVIFGSGAHAKVVLSGIIQIKKYNAVGFIDERVKKGTVIYTQNKKKYRVIGNIDDLKKIYNQNIYGIIGIGSNFLRKKIATQINRKFKRFKWIAVISNNSILNGKVKVNCGSLIVSGSVINTGTVIGKHCIINTSSSIDHDNDLKNFSRTGPRVTTGGNVKLGECSHIGIGSIVKNGAMIKNNSIIGAKSLVLKNCEKNSLYYGVPAKRIRKRKSNENYL